MIMILGIVHLVFAPLNNRPVFRAVVGGMVIGAIGSFLPLTLYSGQNVLVTKITQTDPRTVIIVSASVILDTSPNNASRRSTLGVDISPNRNSRISIVS
jgi:H+/Cl- antiporter ClcA